MGLASPSLMGRKPTPSLRDQWLGIARRIETMIPRGCVNARINRNARFVVDRVYSQGEIQATCEIFDRSFHVYADCGGDLPPAGCSCEESEGEYPCPHVYAFIEYLIGQLRSDATPLARRIERREFTSGAADRSRYQPDPELEAVEALGRLLKRSAAPTETVEEFPQIAQKVAQRIAWNLVAQDRLLVIKPMIQQEKRRGNGFNKPKEITFERLMADREIGRSEADQRVIDSISLGRGSYGYSATWTLNAMATVRQLIGQPNVWLFGQPCRVESRDFYLTLRKIDGRWSFGLEESTGQARRGLQLISDEGIAQIDREESLVLYGLPPGGSTSQIKELVGFPPVSDKHAEVLFEKARQLQTVLPLRLPEEVGGKIIHWPSRPVVLLRSRPDGTLDYGLRMRGHAGRLLKPGQPPAVVPDTVEGKRVQRTRNLSAEVESAITIAKRLGIDDNRRDDWNGEISEWETGINLIEALNDHGDELDVHWDKSSEKPVTILGRLTSKNVKVDITSKRNWFGISGQCDLGGQSMSLEALLNCLPSGTDDSNVRGEYVRIADGQWARVSADLRKRLLRLRDATLDNRKTLALDATAAPVIRELMDSDIEVNATKNWHECIARLGRAERLEPTLPAGLKADLRDYQVDGFKWLRRLAEWGVGGILADDMGLGKTLQTLAVLLDRKDDGPTLVIAPTSVGFNWVREAERFTPELKPHLYRETDRQEFLSDVGSGDLVVCSYGLALRDEEALAKVKWGTLVMDEAQAVKNSRSKTAQAIAGFDAKWTVALTGTPVENHLGELWSLFHLVSPGVLGGWEQFRRRFALPIEKHADSDARQALATRLQPFILRRTKSQVLSELPARTEMNLYVDLSEEERNQYDRVRLSAIGEIDQIASLPNVQDQRFKLLALLTRLRQFACHPGIVNRQWEGSSAKLDQLVETLVELKEEGHRALVFSQFTQHLALIRKAFDQRGITYQYLDGSTPPNARQQAVDNFQAGMGDCFLISLKAGGTGLNLTAADYVIHMDPWWNPAVEDQATDRAHRIGQERPVMVYRIIARGTIEEEILSLHESKRDLVAGVLEGTAAAATMSTGELIEMLRGGT